jgi:hypothetical protein
MNEVVNFASPAKEMRQKLVAATSILEEVRKKPDAAFNLIPLPSEYEQEEPKRAKSKTKSVTNRVFHEDENGPRNAKLQKSNSQIKGL